MTRMNGTRFRLFPQSPSADSVPETVWLRSPPGSIGPGPSDDRMYAVLPAIPKLPYDPPATMPPFAGPRLQPAFPDRGGHFDRVDPSSPQFLAAHLYGCARFTLDTWERHLRRPVRWWHADFLPFLELVPTVDWNNAHAGPGFIETGERASIDGILNLFCLNFDVVAHEMGHAILFAEVGIPAPGRLTPQFLAFHESLSDLIALLAAMEFGSVIERFLDETGGNLYSLGQLGRLAEMSASDQIRRVTFDARIRDFDGFVRGQDGAWYGPNGERRTQHQLSQPLTGAFFAILIEIYQDSLVARRLIGPDDDCRGWTREEVNEDFRRMQARFGELYGARRTAFHATLCDARDWLARSLAIMLTRLRPDDLTFGAIAGTFLEVARERGMTGNLKAIEDYFLDRDIVPEPPRAARRAQLHDVDPWHHARDGGGRPLDPRTALRMVSSVQNLLDHGFRDAPGW
jgi:hypothetical protein